MAVIEEVNLETGHEARWRFHYFGRALPGGSSVLTVTDGARWWEFNCRSEGNDMFCISGSEWRRFVRANVNARVSLSKEDDEGFHRITVR